MTGRDRDGRVIILPSTTADEHIAVQRESMARTTLLQSIPDDHVADFHYMDDARDIWNAVKARLSTTFKPKEPTFQIVLDALSLTPFNQSFLISTNVHAIYMDFISHASNSNTKNYSFDLETFRDMLQICPNLLSQKFVDPQFKEKILAFIRKLSQSRDFKTPPDVKIDTLH
nr:xylulose kinase-1 [Tanacetum cinerariifolium]